MERLADQTRAPRLQKRERSGGKPKGFKHTGQRLSVGDFYASDAEHEFLRLLNKHLPSKAFAELLAGTTADVPAWAVRWKVNAPCVVTAALDNLNTAQHWPDAPRDFLYSFADSYQSPAYPEPWRAEYVALNALPVDVAWLDDVLDSPIEPIASPDEIDSDMRRLGADPKDQWVDALRKRCTALRTEALQKDRVLAPLAADPIRESREEFLARAERHWDGRAARATATLVAHGITFRAPSRKHGLSDYLQWLVWRRIDRKTPEMIAAEACVTNDTVRHGILVAQQLLQLKGPVSRPGRPRKPRNRDSR